MLGTDEFNFNQVYLVSMFILHFLRAADLRYGNIFLLGQIFVITVCCSILFWSLFVKLLRYVYSIVAAIPFYIHIIFYIWQYQNFLSCSQNNTVWLEVLSV